MWNSVRTELGESGADDPDQSYGEAYGDPLDSRGIAFADALLRAYVEHRDAIEAVLVTNVSGWSFNQMAQTDLNVLRLAVTEMYHSDNPPEVAIEMAVRLAKKFGGDESGRFVNGVLAKVYRELKNSSDTDLGQPTLQTVGAAPFEEDDATSGR